MSSPGERSAPLTTEQIVRALLQIGGLSPDSDEITQLELLYPGLRTAADHLYRTSSTGTTLRSPCRTTEEPHNESWWG
jgi:hypothetical protein